MTVNLLDNFYSVILHYKDDINCINSTFYKGLFLVASWLLSRKNVIRKQRVFLVDKRHSKRQRVTPTRADKHTKTYDILLRETIEAEFDVLFLVSSLETSIPG